MRSSRPTVAGWPSAIDSTGTLTVWDVETGEIVHHNRRFRGYLPEVAVLGRRTPGTCFQSDGLARMYDADTGIPLGPAVSQPGRHLAVGVSPDGRRLAVYDDSVNVFRVFDVERGERLLTIPYGTRTRPTALWFDAAGRSLNAVLGGEVLTFPLPRFDVPFADSEALMWFLTGQQIDATDSIRVRRSIHVQEGPGPLSRRFPRLERAVGGRAVTLMPPPGDPFFTMPASV